MRHRKRGRVLGRSPSHRKAMLKNLASALFLTERDATDEETRAGQTVMAGANVPPSLLRPV